MFGIQVVMRLGFNEARTLTDVRLLADGKPFDAVFYPLDGSDPEPPPATVSPASGDEVTVEGIVQAPCTGDASLPVVEVESSAPGAGRTYLFTSDSTAAYRDAVEEWCARPLTMVVTGMRITPEGEQTLTLQLSNPAAEAVTVESRAVQGDGYAWDPATLEVGGGAIETLKITGRSEVATECPPTPPWETNDVLADGQPLQPSAEGVSIC